VDADYLKPSIQEFLLVADLWHRTGGGVVVRKVGPAEDRVHQAGGVHRDVEEVRLFRVKRPTA
jgi:hypothetical protein